MFFSVSSSVRYKTAHALCFGGVSGLAVCLSSHIKNIENNPDTNKVKKNLSFAHFYDSSVLASALRFKAIHYMNSNVPFSYGIPQVNRHALFYLLESGGCKLAEARIYRFFNEVSNLSDGLKKILSGALAIGLVTTCAVPCDVALTIAQNSSSNFSFSNIFRIAYTPHVLLASNVRNFLFTGFTVCSSSMLGVLPDTYRDSIGVNVLTASICGAVSTVPHQIFVQNVRRLADGEIASFSLKDLGNVSGRAMVCRGLYSGMIVVGANALCTFSPVLLSVVSKESKNNNMNSSVEVFGFSISKQNDLDYLLYFSRDT